MPGPFKKSPLSVTTPVAQRIFAAVAGMVLFLVVLKFGTPVVLDKMVQPPESFLAGIIETWQLKRGFLMVAILAVFGLPAVMSRRPLEHTGPPVPRLLLLLPLIWLGWQFLSATHTVSASLTSITLEHFTACVVLFYLGYFALEGVANPWPVWTGLALAVCCVIRAGFEQHFGGLEATRKFIESLKNDPSLMPPGLLQNPEYQARIASNRIFSTFSYANALAGCFILLLPITLVFTWEITPKVRRVIRWVFVIILGGCGLACLYWSGSKAGWLVTIVMTMIALAHSTIPKKWKQILIYGALILGLAGFGIRNAKFFHKQNNSVGARFTYWRAALKITKDHPLLGTGPGTFSVLFEQLKNPNDEMARLCHDDYLEQACDSGLLGFIVYTTMVFWLLFFLYRYRSVSIGDNWLEFSVRLGLLGLCLHSLVEFHLYIPSLAWPLFFLLGWALNTKSYR
jgi:O-antigen ligase